VKKSNVARLACIVSGLTLSGGALAETKGPPPSPATQSASTSSKPASSQVGARAEAEAKKAKRRSDEAAQAGKPLIAERLTSLAATWSKVAAHERRAAELEAEAKETEKKVLELRANAKKAVSLLDQTEARRSRALARLMELGLSDASPQTKANESDAAPSEAQK
jgi:hypothetical protein